MGEPRDPLIHTHITDVLPDDHPQAFESINCSACGEMVHAFNNECMQTWVETGKGNFCIFCFVKIDGVEAIDDEYGLPPQPSDNAVDANLVASILRAHGRNLASQVETNNHLLRRLKGQ